MHQREQDKLITGKAEKKLSKEEHRQRGGSLTWRLTDSVNAWIYNHGNPRMHAGFHWRRMFVSAVSALEPNVCVNVSGLYVCASTSRPVKPDNWVVHHWATSRCFPRHRHVDEVVQSLCSAHFQPQSRQWQLRTINTNNQQVGVWPVVPLCVNQPF